MTLHIPESIETEIVEHARADSPEEVVGVLAGDHDTLTVTQRYPAENAADTPRTRYEIAPREELELLESIDAAGLDVVGFYHSHPQGPAEPSDTDARLAAWPDRVYVIVSLAEGVELTGWRWDGDRFEAESIRIKSE